MDAVGPRVIAGEVADAVGGAIGRSGDDLIDPFVHTDELHSGLRRRLEASEAAQLRAMEDVSEYVPPEPTFGKAVTSDHGLDEGWKGTPNLPRGGARADLLTGANWEWGKPDYVMGTLDHAAAMELIRSIRG